MFVNAELVTIGLRMALKLRLVSHMRNIHVSNAPKAVIHVKVRILAFLESTNNLPIL